MDEARARRAAGLINDWQIKGYQDARLGRPFKPPAEKGPAHDDYSRGYERRYQQERTSVEKEYEARTGRTLTKE